MQNIGSYSQNKRNLYENVSKGKALIKRSSV